MTMIGPYYTGQRPAEPLVITIKDTDGQARDLSNYTAAELLLISPAGETITEGSTTIADPSAGEISYVWPTETILTSPGDYKYQIRLIDNDYEDYTSIGHFEVYGRLGE